MSENIVLLAETSISNLSEVHLGTGQTDTMNRMALSYDYPPGQVIRGAVGHLLLTMNLPLVNTYLDNEHPVLYFRDCLPYHHTDGGLFVPVIVQRKYVNYRCSKCNTVVGRPTFKSVVTKIRIHRETGTVRQMWRQESITNSSEFRFKVIMNLKENPEHVHDFISAANAMKEMGLNLGRGGMKGGGRFVVGDMRYHVVTMDEIKSRADTLKKLTTVKVRLRSDTIIEEKGVPMSKIDDKLLNREIKRASKFFLSDYKPYPDAVLKLKDFETLNLTKISFLDYKVKERATYTTESAIPSGSTFSYEVSSAPEEFWTGLALLEQCFGIGKRVSAGKGEIAIES